MQNNHPTPTHRTSRFCSFTSKFPIWPWRKKPVMRPLQHPRGNQNWFIGSYGSGIIDFFLFSNTFYSIILVLSVYAKLICISNTTKWYCQKWQNSVVLRSKTTHLNGYLTEFTTEFNILNATIWEKFQNVQQCGIWG